jgi:hypothetical protein
MIYFYTKPKGFMKEKFYKSRILLTASPVTKASQIIFARQLASFGKNGITRWR